MMDYNDRVAKQESAMWNQASRPAVGRAWSPIKLPTQEQIREKEAFMAQREAVNQCLAAPPPMKELPRLLNQLFNATAKLEDRAMELEAQLNPVLRPDYPAVASGGEIKAATETELGLAIDGIVVRLENVANRMEGLIERVQV